MSKLVHLQPAWLLHRREYRNTSLLVEVFSRDHGRRGLLAKGARRRGAAAGPLLQPFRPLLVSWSGRGELPVVTGVEPGSGRALDTLQARGAYAGGAQAGAVLCGFYLNELLMRLLAREDAHQRLFACYASTLGALAEAAAGSVEATLLRRFEVALLQELGYGLVLDRSVDDGNAITAGKLYHYQQERGPLASAARSAGAAVVAVHGSTLLGLDGGELDSRGQREARELIRGALAPHLGERPLRSRALYRDWLQLRGGRT